jgi:predicted DNA-binding protein (MmcQ/YjbR family)
MVKKMIMDSQIKNFKSELTLKIIDYISEKYCVKPEFLWESSPASAAVRNKSTGKWFGVIIGNLPKSKLGLASEEKCEIINLKCDPLFVSLTVDGKGYFRAYHMNKEKWISVLLDGTVPFEEICEIIDMSYEIINSKRRMKNEL